jgi:hypothetical protein
MIRQPEMILTALIRTSSLVLRVGAVENETDQIQMFNSSTNYIK